jgi:hypothetical protein
MFCLLRVLNGVCFACSCIAYETWGSKTRRQVLPEEDNLVGHSLRVADVLEASVSEASVTQHKPSDGYAGATAIGRYPHT